MKTFNIRSIISTHVYTYIMENCKIIMNIKNKMSKKKKTIIFSLFVGIYFFFMVLE